MSDPRLILPFSVRQMSNADEWSRWKDTLEFYFTAKNISNAKRKQAELLLLGGPEIQDIYYSFPKDTPIPADSDEYNFTLSRLDSQIEPKSNKWYERHVLSTLKQGKGETLTAFITRLRNQAKLCSFASTFVDEAVQGQLINGCSSAEVRTELMKQKEDATLADFERVARTLETVTSQSSAMASGEFNSTQVNANTSNVCRIPDKKRNSKGKKFQREPSKRASSPDRDNTDRCFCCGHSGHRAKDPKCPALKAVCGKCKKNGHYSKVCHSSAAGQSNSSSRDKNEQRKESVKKVTHEDIFCVRNDSSDEIEEWVPCRIGNIGTKMFVDSGALYTMLSRKQWRKLKRNGAQFQGFVRNPEINFFDATGEKQYTVAFTVQAEIQCNDQTVISEIVVVEEDIQSLLGRQDAKALQVLRVGLNACKDTRIRAIPNLMKPLGKLKNFQLHIPIDESVPPVIQPFRRIPYALRAKVEKQINELLEADVIERVEGPSRWVSPIVPVADGEDDIRLCVDMRRANEAVLDEKFPLPVMDDLAPLLAEATVFSKVDLIRAYHQAELDEESREITTFITHLGLFRYKRLMFGLTCAPEMFQRILEGVLSGLIGVFNFIDDIFVFGKTQEEHDLNLRNLLHRLEEHGLTINPKKCQFRMNEVTFLGHIIKPGVIQPGFDKVASIKEFRSPETPEELRSFIGLVSYVGKFIPHLSTELDLLQRTARESPFKWDAADEQAFVHIQSLLSDETHLSLFDPTLTSIVMADASPVGLGAVLLQRKGDEVRVICYISRSLSAVERRYSQTEKEALALVFAVERLKIYLLGRTFELVTDHKPLQTIFGTRSKPCARIERWVLRMQGFKYVIRYAPGKNNIADPLSRLLQTSAATHTINDMYEKNLINFVTQLAPKAVTLREIRKATENDPELSKICDSLISNQEIKLKPFSAIASELCVVEGVLLRGVRIIVPAELRDRVLQNAHEGHPGINKIKDRLRSKVWWPNIDKHAETCVKTCDTCQKVGKQIVTDQISRRDFPDGPWQQLAIDFKSLPDGKELCAVVDYFSRYVEVKIMKSTTVEDTTAFLDELFARHGIPSTITSDNGPQFRNKFEEYLRSLGIAHYTSCPYWARANGEIERQNRSLQKIIKIAVLEKKDIQSELNKYLLMYRSTPHSTLGKSPAELLFNRRIQDKLPTLRPFVEEAEVREKDRLNKSKSIMASGKPLPLNQKLQVGDEVLIERPFTKNKFQSKFEDEIGVIEAINGPVVNIATPTKNIQRHENQVEKYTRATPATPTTPVPDNVPVSEPVSDQANDPPEEPLLRRSSRVSKPPKWLEKFQN
ncbi:uncharacterized protein K02A2.6-like [Planococcus citri]|uniref:uncharacterized protein K02A2.6-like n=1 Tax=Planococcus citri TaxID=170843 RepID=UPI0031F909E9